MTVHSIVLSRAVGGSYMTPAESQYIQAIILRHHKLRVLDLRVPAISHSVTAFFTKHYIKYTSKLRLFSS
jgi:hypothetical protein